MKLVVAVLAASMAANAALVTVFVRNPSLAPAEYQSYFESPAARAARRVAVAAEEQRESTTRAGREAAIKQEREAKLWSTLQSDDLRTLVQHLRAAGFPPKVVRAVVSAEIDRRFAGQMAALRNEAENTPYWKPQTIWALDAKMIAQRNQLTRDRVKLMRDILGDDFFADSAGDLTQLQQARFGGLSKQKADVVQRIVDDYAEMTSDVRNATRGIMLPEDREKLAFLDQQRRADLAAVLTPQELEDYEMRTSPITGRLRPVMTLMDASEDEFRTIFRLEQKYDAQLDPFQGAGGIYSSDMMRQRNDAQTQLNSDVAAALGPTRGAEFERDASNDFQQLARLAKSQDLPIDAAIHAYDIRNQTAAESWRIADDNSVPVEQRVAALKALAQQAKSTLLTALGPTAGQTYVNSANWLQAMERGASVSFHGNVTSFRSIAPMPPRPRRQ